MTSKSANYAMSRRAWRLGSDSWLTSAGASKDAEIVVVIAHRAPTQPDPFEPLPAANSPENNDAAGNQVRTLFPCCKNPYQDGLDGQAGR